MIKFGTYIFYLAPKLLLGSVSLDNALFIEIGIPKQELGNEKIVGIYLTNKGV